MFKAINVESLAGVHTHTHTHTSNVKRNIEHILNLHRKRLGISEN